MCIAILNSSGLIDEQSFRTCWENNPDGAGIAYVENNTVKILKEMKSPKRLFDRYTAIRQHNDLPMIVHFRIATSGMVDKENCHPFEVVPGLVVAHNGIIDNVEATARTSDTRVFIDEVLKKLPRGFINNEGITRLISEFIDNSKLVFLDGKGMFTIINESLGHWDAACVNWYSNRSYCEFYGYGFERYGFSGFYPATGEREDRLSAEPDWGVCDGCGDWVPAHDFTYDPYLNAALCSDCRAWFLSDEKNEVIVTARED